MPEYPISDVQREYFISQLDTMAMDVTIEIWAPTETVTSGGIAQVFHLQETVRVYSSSTQRRELEDAQSGAITTTSIWQFGLPLETVVEENYQLKKTNEFGQLDVYEVKATWVDISHKLWLIVEAIKRN